jgi:hypothetical protein
MLGGVAFLLWPFFLFFEPFGLPRPRCGAAVATAPPEVGIGGSSNCGYGPFGNAGSEMVCVNSLSLLMLRVVRCAWLPIKDCNRKLLFPVVMPMTIYGPLQE